MHNWFHGGGQKGEIASAKKAVFPIPDNPGIRMFLSEQIRIGDQSLIPSP